MARILVIEDHPDNLELMVYLLAAFGHDVLVAKDGAKGLAMATREPVDLVLCDLHLPELDGYEIAKRLKADPVFACIPLIAVTASTMVGDRARCLAAGFDGYIGKPIVPEELIVEIDGVLRAATRPVGPEDP